MIVDDSDSNYDDVICVIVISAVIIYIDDRISTIFFIGTSKNDYNNNYQHCYINRKVNFIAAGDYFHNDPSMMGTIESAFISSQAATNAVTDRIRSN